MTLYYIVKNKTKNNGVTKLLRKACRDKKITFKMLESEKIDIASPPLLENGSMVYRSSTDRNSSLLEKKITHTKVATLRKTHEDLFTHRESFYAFKQVKLPVIPQIRKITRDRKRIEKHVKLLGGFPVVIKAPGASHGVGVMKLDSMESLVSVVDYLVARTPQSNFVLMKYIDYTVHARLIVLGDKVVGSIEYKRVTNDFRSNAGKDICAEKKKFPKEIQEVAIKATHALGNEFAGVDILITEDGKFYLAEANFPCYFPRCQNVAGIDIAGKMIDHLVKKAKKLKK